MKNLKRVLSLGLASVMLVGMMVVGASAADFTDAEDIVHDEAVKVLVALNVINGKEDGSYFAPKDNVTRGEMAKMIATIKLGGSGVNTGVKTVPSFTDIGGHWAEAYIEYCADMGIISGRGDGTFDPNGNVTNLEATKMVLTTLGYEAKAYHLEGATWASQTDELARSTCDPQLYKDLQSSLVMNEPATRDTAAQILWNGLQNETRTINPEKNTNNLEVTWGYGGSGKTLLKERYDGDIMLGTYVGNYDYQPNGALKGEIAVQPASGAAVHFPSDLSIDNIGEEVRVIWKDGDKGTDGSPDNKDTIFGVFNTGATRVVRSQLSKIKDQKSSKAQINIDGSKYDTTNTVAVITNYSTEADKAANDGNDTTNSALTSALKRNSGNPIKAVFDDDGKIDTIYVTESYVAAVTAVNSTSITLNNGAGSALKFEDHDIEEGLKKGDVVVYTPLYGTSATATDGIVTVAKAEVVSGEVTGYKNTSTNDDVAGQTNYDDSITIDGKTYKFNYQNGGQASAAGVSAKNGLLATIPDADDVITKFAKSENSYIGEDVDLYLANGYVVAAVQTSETSNNYSVVTEVKTATAGSVFSALQLQVMGADGTKDIITVSDDDVNDINNDGDVDQDDFNVGDIVTYTFDKNDEAEVKVRDAAAVKTVSYNSKAKTVNGKATSADCVFFAQTKTGLTLGTNAKVLSGAEWEAYDIRSLDTDSWTTKVAAVYTKDDKVVAVFVDVADTPEGAKDDTIYGVVSDYTGRVKDYYTYTIQANGEEYSVSYKSNALQKGDLVSFRPTADNTYNSGKINEIKTTEPNYFVGYVKEYSSRDNTLTFFDSTESDGNGAYVGSGTAKTYALDSDCKIIYVDQDNQKSLGEGTIDEFNAIENKPNVAFITKLSDGDTVIDVLFVETSGKEHVNYRNK